MAKKNKKLKKSKKEKYYLVSYVVDSCPKLKKFTSSEKLVKFVENFLKKYPESECFNSGSWVDYVVTGVTGKLEFFSKGIDLT